MSSDSDEERVKGGDWTDCGFQSAIAKKG